MIKKAHTFDDETMKYTSFIKTSEKGGRRLINIKPFDNVLDKCKELIVGDPVIVTVRIRMYYMPSIKKYGATLWASDVKKALGY